MRQVAGMSGVAGIGFTVSIFVAGLAFADPLRTDQAILGVLVASLLAGSLGSTILLTQSEGERYTDADNQPTRTTGAAGPTPSSTTPPR